jgi:hypothetical protein
LMLPLDDLMSQGECWKVRSMHHDACTHVRVLGHQNNMRDNKGVIIKGSLPRQHRDVAH